MYKTLSILAIISLLSPFALAGEDHTDEHDHHGDMMQHDMSATHGDAHEYGLGKPGDPARVRHTVEVSMNDNMRFTPDHIKVKAGETVRFTVKNNGKLRHEMVIGDMDELKEHAEMMRKMPGMKHEEPNMVSLEAGQSKAIVWEFEKAGTVSFACLVPGHMEAGMVGVIEAK